MFGECNTRKQWSWEDFIGNIKHRFFVDECMPYVLLKILSELIGVFLGNSTQASCDLQGDTVGDLTVVFAMAKDKWFIPIQCAKDEKIDELLEQSEFIVEIATVVVVILIVV